MADSKRSWLRGARDKIEAHVDGVKSQQAEGAAAAANLVVEKDFGATRVAIYDGGFVRVSKLVTPLTPYEKLRLIKFEQQTQDRSGVGQVWAGGPLASSQAARRVLSGPRCAVSGARADDEVVTGPVSRAAAA